jgi:hypothetical protein
MRALTLLCFATVVTGCANEVSVSRNYIPQRGVPGHADYAKALGPVPVVMLNSPFAPPTVVAALQRNDPRRHQFTTDPPSSLEGGYRILLGFDRFPPGGLYVCRGPLTEGAPAATPQPAQRPTSTSIYGAFCLGPALLSEAVATAPRVDSPDDPRFARLMGDLLTALMPFRDPYDNPGNRCFPPC